MPASSREEELGRGQRGEAPAARPTTGGAPSGPALIVWVVTRRIEHETVVLGVRMSDVAAARLVDDDIADQAFPHGTVVRYGVHTPPVI